MRQTVKVDGRGRKEPGSLMTTPVSEITVTQERNKLYFLSHYYLVPGVYFKTQANLILTDAQAKDFIL